MAKNSKNANKVEVAPSKHNFDFYFAQEFGFATLFGDLCWKLTELSFNHDFDIEPWVTTEYLSNQMVAHWAYRDKAHHYHHFLNWWTGKMVDEYGYMLWNVVWKTKRKTMKDADADKFADAVVKEFVEYMSSGPRTHDASPG